MSYIWTGNDKKIHDLGFIAGLKAASEIVQKHSEEWEGETTCRILNTVDEEIEAVLKNFNVREQDK